MSELDKLLATQSKLSYNSYGKVSVAENVLAEGGVTTCDHAVDALLLPVCALPGSSAAYPLLCLMLLCNSTNE